MEVVASTHKKIADQPIRKWAEENCILAGDHGHSGEFNMDNALWLVEPFEAAKDNAIRELIIQKATQTLGSTFGQIVLEWFMVNRPMPAKVIMQTKDMAEDFMTQRFIPSFKRNKVLGPLLPKNPKQLKEDGLVIKDSMSLKVQGPSRNNINSATLGLLILDELWKYGNKGYLEMARKRLSYYRKAEASKLIIVSMGGKEGEDLDNAWKESSQHTWHVCCEKCKHYFDPDIEHFNAEGKRWNDKDLKLKSEDGKYNFAKLEKVLTLQCPACKHLHRDSAQLKQYWNQNGKYIQMNPTPLKGVRGYRWTAVIHVPWIDIIKEFLTALEQLRKQGTEDFELFFQSRFARPVDVWSWQVRGKSVRSNVDYDPKLIEPDTYRFFGVDVQEYGMFGSVFSCTKQGQPKLIWAGELLDLQDLLDRCKEFSVSTDKDGKYSYVMIDSQFKTREIYTWCLEYGFKPVRGNGKERSFTHTIINNKGKEEKITKFWIRRLPDPSTGGPNQQRLKIPFYELALDGIKEIGQKLRDDPDGLLALPSGKYDIAEWQKQMFSERRAPKKEGEKAAKWPKIKWDAQNHYWDCYIYALAGMLMHKDISIKEHLVLTSTEELEEELKEAA